MDAPRLAVVARSSREVLRVVTDGRVLERLKGKWSDVAKNVFYRQCELERNDGKKRECQVSWIPEQYAVVGKYLKLKDDGSWTDGWRVISVGEIRCSAEEVSARSRDYRSQRRVSDI